MTARESWFPSFGAFDDRTHYTLHFLSPKRFKFVGTGRLVKSEKDKEGLETDWDSDVPLSVVGFNYGDFVEKSQSDSNLTVTAYGGKEVPDELKRSGAIDGGAAGGGIQHLDSWAFQGRVQHCGQRSIRCRTQFPGTQALPVLFWGRFPSKPLR